MKGLIVPLICIIMFTGIAHSLLYAHIGINLVVGAILGLGVSGLYISAQSYRYRDKNLRIMLLLVGFLSLLIAYFTLETLLRL